MDGTRSKFPPAKHVSRESELVLDLELAPGVQKGFIAIALYECVGCLFLKVPICRAYCGIGGRREALTVL